MLSAVTAKAFAATETAPRGAAHGDLLQRNRRSDSQRRFQNRAVDRMVLAAAEAQAFISETAKDSHHDCHNRAGEHRSEPRAEDAEARNQQSVERHIEHAHDGV